MPSYAMSAKRLTTPNATMKASADFLSKVSGMAEALQTENILSWPANAGHPVGFCITENDTRGDAECTEDELDSAHSASPREIPSGPRWRHLGGPLSRAMTILDQMQFHRRFRLAALEGFVPVLEGRRVAGAGVEIEPLGQAAHRRRHPQRVDEGVGQREIKRAAHQQLGAVARRLLGECAHGMRAEAVQVL